MDGACEERRPEVSAAAVDLERVVLQASELMAELAERLGAVLAPAVPNPVNTEDKLGSSFSAPLAQHLDGLKTRMSATIQLGEGLLKRIEV